jgi:hypothetical protein
MRTIPPESDDALEGRLDRHRVDDVGGDEEFEAEQDRPAKVGSKVRNRLVGPPPGDMVEED